MVWTDLRDGNEEIYFARLNLWGTKLTGDIRITDDPGGSSAPHIAWTGREFGIVWQDDRHGNWVIYFTRVTPDGVKLGSDTRITDDPANSYGLRSLVWTGTEYATVWRDKRDGNWEVYFARIDPDGQEIGSEVRITNNTSYSSEPVLAWTGDGYGVAWIDIPDADWEIYFTLVAADGTPSGYEERMTVSASASRYPSLAWSGTEFGLAWQDARGGDDEIYFARIDDTGHRLPGDTRVTTSPVGSSLPSLAWTGSEYGLAWDEGTGLYLARVNSGGGSTGGPVALTGHAAASREPSLAWTGIRYALAWQDSRDGNQEVYFANVECCDDVDGDLWTECDDCDDSDPLTHPGAAELCDHKDNNCDSVVDEGFPEPAQVQDLAFSDAASMDWSAAAGADRYDLVRGDLQTLATSGGDYGLSLDSCLENDGLDTAAVEPAAPPPGGVYYYLVRGEYVCIAGSFDTGGLGQHQDRDAAITSSPNCCP